MIGRARMMYGMGVLEHADSIFEVNLRHTVTQRIPERVHDHQNGGLKVIMYRLDMKVGVLEHTQFIHKLDLSDPLTQGESSRNGFTKETC